MVLVTSSLHDTNARTINQIYVFGDSLSDTGNMYRTTNRNYPPNPPYFQGRYSNGQVWVEYLGSKLALNTKDSANFAFGGAMTGKVSNNGIPGLLGQVENFTKNQLSGNDSGLYVIWAGANDYIYGVADSTTPVINITQAIESLLNAGAKKILVVDLPDLGNLPATKNNGSSQSLSAVTKAHNQGLAKSLSQLRQKFDSKSEIIELNVSELYRDAISNPSKYGFTNVTSACLYQGATCNNPDQYLFWDGIHPTTAAHQIIAEKAFTVLNTRTEQLQLGAA
ncbi:GDSL family lipase [Calothrix sp. NIES-4071]|nr:GDSL family lipase [Calothrix sp. NIES-4071]BAZ59816.1 GDSL family lipase [Calothrix sp. NIES-4105]